MNFASVVGTIWATQKHPLCENLVFQILQPECASGEAFGEKIIAVDTVGAGQGERVFYVTAKESNIPLDVEMAPVDAAIVGIVEGVEHKEDSC